jgi:hypothetical protein
MLTKLTLTIEKGVIERAKEYAQDRNKSVSRIVEEYLDGLSKNRIRPSAKSDLQSPNTESLGGMFSDTGEDYKKILDDARSERFL